MQHEPNSEPSLRELIESCRPDQNDWTRPEMAELARKLAASPELRTLHQRLQRFDSAISAAFRDVAAPEGLQSRILARLAAERRASLDSNESRPTVQKDQSLDAASVGNASRAARRRWLFTGVGAAAAVAGSVWLVFALLPRAESIAKAELMSAAIERFWNEPADQGQLAAASASRYPMSPAVIELAASRIAVVRWRPLGDFFGREADAFDLIGPGGRLATVFAGELPVEGLPPHVPQRPMLSTGETAASAWQERDVVYVLVVAGGERGYERLVGLGAGPVT